MTVKIQDATGKEHEVLGPDDFKSLETKLGELGTTLEAKTTEMITGLGTRLKKEIAATLAPTIADALKPAMDEFGTRLKAELKPPEPEPKPGDKKPDGAKPDDPNVVALKKLIEDQRKASADEMAALKKQLTDAETAKKAEADKASELRLRQDLRKELGKLGIVAEEAADAAETFLFDGKKRIGRSAEDNTTPIYKDPTKGEQKLSEGLASWIKTAEDKLYLPPTGAGGSGEKPGGKPLIQQGSDKRSPAEVVGNAFIPFLTQ